MGSLAMAVVPALSVEPHFDFHNDTLHCWYDLSSDPAGKSYVVSVLLLGVVAPTVGECALC